MSEEEFAQKFLDCVVPGYGEQAAETLFAQLRKFDQLKSVSGIQSLTRL